jgi:superfamily II RNA helicase
MVKVCPDTYDNNDTYHEHFDLFPYELSVFQKYAVEGIVTGNHVLVTAPTGSGKTLPAEFAIQYFVEKGKKVVYCSPIKSLSNQKFYEFSKKYPHISFGIFTGDLKTNPEANVLIMTTEILQNYLFMQTAEQPDKTLSFQLDIHDLGAVIFDEVHYINDRERGQVWEKTFLLLPPQVQTVSLSATIDNPQGFAQWIEDRYKGAGAKQVYLASTNHRIVPLSHYGFITVTESIFKHVKDKDIQKQIRDNTNTLIPLQAATNKFNDAGYLTLKKYVKMLEDNQVHINRKHTMNQLMLFLRDRDMLPAIAFVFSRKNVEAMAKEVTIPLLEDDSKVPYTTARDCEQIIRKLPNYTEYLQLPEYVSLVGLLEKGIGIHHSGMIPVLREIVELFISQKKIKLLFATESFAIGLDCPIRTAIFTSLTKFDGQNERYLLAHEYTQAAGRAGRRGIDSVGHVVHCNNLFKVPTLGEYKTILGGVPQTLVSKFHISYGLILNLVKNGTTAVKDMYTFCEKSMVKGELDKVTAALKKRIVDLETTVEKKKDTVKLKPTPVEVCREYLRLEETLKTSVNKKRKECERAIAALKDEHKHLLKDIVAVKELDNLADILNQDYVTLQNNESWIKTNLDAICKLLCENAFVVCADDAYDFTTSGKIASCLAEVHPLIMTQVLVDTNYFEYLSCRQLIGIFSCFTDVKVTLELRASIPRCADEPVNKVVNTLRGLTETYERAEQDLSVFTGTRYDEMLMFDMIQYAMDWTDCTTEQECKYFIQSVISEKGISVGDFTKAMMKIVTISRELENVCETVFAGSQLDLLYKLRQIEGLVLKYVLTSQSLYV